MNELREIVALGLPFLIAMGGLVLGSGFFSACETALFSLSREEVRLFRLGKSHERVVATLLRDPDRLLTAILFWNLIVNLTYFALSVVVSQRLSSSGHQIAAGTIGVASLVMLILGGEVIPKSVAVVFPQRLAFWFCYPLAIAVGVLDPVSPGLNKISRLARRTFWPHIAKEPYLDADDLERAVDLSHLEVDVARHERQILHNILDLTDIRVEEVMRPRGSYLAIEEAFRLSDVGHEPPPGDCVLIVEPGTENISAAIPLAHVAHLPERDLAAKTEPVVVVPWSARLATTLQEMTRKFCHVAVVVNEYGETVGIVTFDDIMDTIVTPEASRGRRILKREPILEIAPGKFHVEGITTLRYLARKLDVDHEPGSDGLLTVAGMMHDQLEHIPEVGDECEWHGYRFRVIDVMRRGQLRAVVSRSEDVRPRAEEEET